MATTIKSEQVKGFLKAQINDNLLKSLNYMLNSSSEMMKAEGRKLIKEYNTIKKDRMLLDLMLTNILTVMIEDISDDVRALDYIDTHTCNYLSFINHSELLKELQEKESKESQTKTSSDSKDNSTDNIAQSIVQFTKEKVLKDLNNIEAIAKEIDRIFDNSDDGALRITLLAMMLDYELFLDMISNEYLEMVEQADLKDMTLKDYIAKYTEKHLRNMLSF